MTRSAQNQNCFDKKTQDMQTFFILFPKVKRKKKTPPASDKEIKDATLKETSQPPFVKLKENMFVEIQ